jgi:hypothetical protein
MAKKIESGNGVVAAASAAAKMAIIEINGINKQAKNQRRKQWRNKIISAAW